MSSGEWYKLTWHLWLRDEQVKELIERQGELNEEMRWIVQGLVGSPDGFYAIKIKKAIK